MDTSETYVKMCEKAEEIQNVLLVREPIPHFDDEDFMVCHKCKEWPIKCVFSDCTELTPIWLPRQDQLQEMINENNVPAIVILHLFKEWAYKEHKPFKTMEQLWLAFVMSEKYGKVWNEEEWESPQKSSE